MEGGTPLLDKQLMPAGRRMVKLKALYSQATKMDSVCCKHTCEYMYAIMIKEKEAINSRVGRCVESDGGQLVRAKRREESDKTLFQLNMLKIKIGTNLFFFFKR